MNRTWSRFIVGATVIVAMTIAACQGTAGRPASRKSLNVWCIASGIRSSPTTFAVR
jgi:hypothetical protein